MGGERIEMKGELGGELSIKEQTKMSKISDYRTETANLKQKQSDSSDLKVA